MFSDESRQTAFKCDIIHSLPGRIRINCKGLAYLSGFNSDMLLKINNIEGVTESTISNITSNILLYYNTELVNQNRLLEAVENIISQYAIHAYQNELIKKNSNSVEERNLHDESISKIIFNLTLSLGLMGLSFLKKRNNPLGRGNGIFNIVTGGILFLSYPLLKSGTVAVKKNKRPNADTLEAIAILTSLLSGRELSSLTILFLHNAAELMTIYAMNRTKNAIRGLLSVQGDFVWKVTEDGSLVKTKVEDVEIEDLVVNHPGEKISIDGVITEGNALIDQSAITGEYMPSNKSINDEVFAGTVVKTGTITIKALAIGDSTAVSRIINMVENAPNKKAAIQNYADKLSEILIPANLILFVSVWFFTKNISKALNMLVIDYSCGIRLSTATALTAAINTAAKNNVLIKGSNVIEQISSSDTLILDKTGTLTKGRPEVVSILPVTSDISTLEILEYAAAAEETSSHPVASSILDKLRSKGGHIKPHGKILVITSRGVETTVEKVVVRVGNKRFMNENKIHTHPLREQVTKLSLSGENVVFVSKNKNVIGVIGIRDPLRDNMRKAINRLRINAKIDDIILLTGDQEQQAEVVSNRLGLDRYDSELMPEDKAKAILQLQSNGSGVVMVGDGINDAPALAYADVGIAMGTTKTDIAMETADVTIASDNPLMLPSLYSLTNETMSVIKQNFAVSIGINTVGLLLGGVGAISVFTGALLHNSSTILVVGNSLRILFFNMKKRN
ncbi:MAG: cation-translocating P-type ATPase [bacterium]|nr:cation-translocating P-type ATPase [bacterium]